MDRRKLIEFWIFLSLDLTSMFKKDLGLDFENYDQIKEHIRKLFYDHTYNRYYYFYYEIINCKYAVEFKNTICRKKASVYKQVLHYANMYIEKKDQKESSKLEFLQVLKVEVLKMLREDHEEEVENILDHMKKEVSYTILSEVVSTELNRKIEKRITEIDKNLYIKIVKWIKQFQEISYVNESRWVSLLYRYRNILEEKKLFEKYETKINKFLMKSKRMEKNFEQKIFSLETEMLEKQRIGVSEWDRAFLQELYNPPFFSDKGIHSIVSNRLINKAWKEVFNDVSEKEIDILFKRVLEQVLDLENKENIVSPNEWAKKNLDLF